MIILSTSLSRFANGLGPGCKVATDYSFLDFAGQAQQAKGRLKSINGKINGSSLLVFYQVIFMENLP